MTKRVSFRVRREYFDKIVSGEKTEELRSNTAFWRRRLWGITDGRKVSDRPEVAVFVCGKDVHRRKIVGFDTAIPEKVLGRPLSERGRRDITTRSAIVIKLGEEVR